MHKYYVSITEAEYNAATQTFGISIKFIGHDLEQCLEESGFPALYIGTEKEDKRTDAYLQKFINKRLHIVSDEESLQFKLLGKEVNNDDFIYCYLESQSVKMPKTLTVKNTLLTHTFKEQKNAVHLKINSKKYTFNFDKEKVIETHTIE